MSKKFYHRMAAIIVCLAFLVSLAPVLNCAEQNTTRPISLENLKASFRLLGYIFPLLAPLSQPQSDKGKAVEKVDGKNFPNMTPKSTGEATSIDPKTKD